MELVAPTGLIRGDTGGAAREEGEDETEGSECFPVPKDLDQTLTILTTD